MKFIFSKYIALLCLVISVLANPNHPAFQDICDRIHTLAFDHQLSDAEAQDALRAVVKDLQYITVDTAFLDSFLIQEIADCDRENRLIRADDIIRCGMLILGAAACYKISRDISSIRAQLFAHAQFLRDRGSYVYIGDDGSFGIDYKLAGKFDTERDFVIHYSEMGSLFWYRCQVGLLVMGVLSGMALPAYIYKAWHGDIGMKAARARLMWLRSHITNAA